MDIRMSIEEDFRKFVDDPANIENGVVNWDFVEADLMIEYSVDNIIEQMGSLSEFYDLFNSLVSHWKHHNDS